ncbi:peroxidase-like isoform X2 [Physella acuta]|uniref:peroxidase-like isoform X2 n=1 Tax=Physella acuta TaxID=109671 RepID=UPI0027DE89E0|nr:peroxidase-like isoform X2 [Physella acuta]
MINMSPFKQNLLRAFVFVLVTRSLSGEVDTSYVPSVYTELPKTDVNNESSNPAGTEDVNGVQSLDEISQAFSVPKAEFQTRSSNGMYRMCVHAETLNRRAPDPNSSLGINLTLNYNNSCPVGGVYRTIDGTCAHPKNYGAAFTSFIRLLPARYEDGLEKPVTHSVTGKLLPSPRVVSRVVHTDQNLVSQFTIMLMQWGQLMDHDMVSTPLVVEDTRNIVTCCGPNKTLPTGPVHPECFPITFDSDPNFQGQCMEFVRSIPYFNKKGKVILPRQNINIVTSFIDASTVYGSTEAINKRLRDQDGKGYLFQLNSGKPISNGKNDCLKRPGRNDVCYLAGDERVNEQPGLTALHTIFMLKHNQWALELREKAPWLPEEEVYQKTRSLLIAVMEKIMYNEWLPIILGNDTVHKEGIYTPLNKVTYFDKNVNPSIFNAFSTAVFRFGHTLIPKKLFLGGDSRQSLRDLFFQPYLLFERSDLMTTNLVGGETEEDRSLAFDRFVTTEVTDHLFENQEGPMKGFDLLALNLQRSRDHGLPSYNDFRELCHLPRVKSFKDPVLGEGGLKFKEVYAHPDDIELFSGGINEKPFKGGIVGETFNCLIARQMKALKYGDRYFFSHYRGQLGFTKRQLREIHGYTLAKLMCDTTALTEVQANALMIAGPNNPKVSCSTLPGINIDHFAYDWER